MSKCLIYYGTSEGHTARVAERVAERLREHSIDADIVASTSKVDLSQYSAVVVGDSVHMGRYHRHVLRFIRKNAPAIESKPNAFFSVCLAAASKHESEQVAAQRLVDDMVRQTKWKPRQRAVFAGALMYSRYGLLKKYIMRQIAAAEGGDTDTSRDYVYTDWNKVDDFVDVFAVTVQAQNSQTSVVN